MAESVRKTPRPSPRDDGGRSKVKQEQEKGYEMGTVMSTPMLSGEVRGGTAHWSKVFFGRDEKGWWFRDGAGDCIYGPSRSEMIHLLSMAFDQYCENCGRELRRSEAGVCSDCHEKCLVADVDDDAFEAAREKAGAA